MARHHSTSRRRAGRWRARPEAALQSPWMERLARAGYAARGGRLRPGRPPGRADGVRRPRSHGHGHPRRAPEGGRAEPALLWLLAVGLFGYAIWRVVQGVLDPERKGSDLKGLAHRAGRVGSGLIYGSLAVAAVRIALGGRAGSGGAAPTRSGRRS